MPEIEFIHFPLRLLKTPFWFVYSLTGALQRNARAWALQCKLLQSCDQEEVESLWISMRPHSLPRQITSIVLGVIYHSTGNLEPENVILRDHIQKNLDALLLKQPNALVVLTGDFNSTSTGFQAQYIAGVNPLKQLVSFKTRDTGTIDWFFTNRSKLFALSQLPKV